MAELMGDGERRAQAVVLDDAAAPVRVAHGSQLRKTFAEKKRKENPPFLTQGITDWSHFQIKTLT